ncbi:MAG: formate dehydrogenase accessory sulfurtransferase FdhD, partial [Planctomycetota bacterium]
MQTTRSILKWHAGEPTRSVSDVLAAEEPMEIRIRGRSISVTMRTPAPGTREDEELAAGFLLTEGLIRNAADIHRIEHCRSSENDNVVHVIPSPDVPIDLTRLTRHVFASSSCGLCGKASIESVQQQFEPLPREDGEKRVRADQLADWAERLRTAQPVFAQTGGLHAAALFDMHGEIVACREDVGRHNAVDKVLGHALLHDRLPLDRHVLMVSGRASF